MNEQIRRFFPATEKYAYLNSAARRAAADDDGRSRQFTIARRFGKRFGAFSRMDTDEKARARDSRGNAESACPNKSLLCEILLMVLRRSPTVWIGRKAKISSLLNGNFRLIFMRGAESETTFGVELRLCPERDGRIDLDEFIDLIDANTRACLDQRGAVRFGLSRRSGKNRKSGARSRRAVCR